MRFPVAASLLLLAACGGPGGVEGLPAGLTFEVADARAVDLGGSQVIVTLASVEMRCLDPWSVDPTGSDLLLTATLHPAPTDAFSLNRRSPASGWIEVDEHHPGVRIAGRFESTFEDLVLDGEDYGTFTLSGDFDASFCTF